MTETEVRMRRPRGRATLVAALRLGVTAALLGILLWLVDLRAMGAVLASMDVRIFAGALGLGVADRALMAAKWLPLLRVHVPEAGFLACFRAYLLSNFAVLVLPVSASAEILRAVALGRRSAAVVEVGASIVAERLLGLAGVGLLGGVAVGVSLAYDLAPAVIVPWAALAAIFGLTPLLLVWLLGRTPSVRRLAVRSLGQRGAPLLERVSNAWDVYGSHRRRIFWVGVLSFVEQLLPIAITWTVAQALGLPVGFAMLVATMPLVLVVVRIPIAFGGIGVAEGGLVYLLGLLGVPAAEALALGLASRLVEILVAMPGSLFWSDVVRARAEQNPA